MNNQIPYFMPNPYINNQNSDLERINNKLERIEKSIRILENRMQKLENNSNNTKKEEDPLDMYII